MIEFTALEAIVKLSALTIAIEEETRAALEKAAKLVQEEAKAELGTYQGAAPPFVGWAELSERRKDDRVQAGYSENEPGLASGAMRESIGVKLEHREAHIGSDLPEAEYFELGTVKQPPRSFLGAAAIRKEHEVVDLIGEGAKTALVGDGVSSGRLGLRK